MVARNVIYTATLSVALVFRGSAGGQNVHAIPDTLLLTSEPAASAGSDWISLTNKDTSPLVAYVYEATCGRTMHTRTYSDAALVYAAPQAVGESRSIATVTSGCKGGLGAAVFADGRKLGTPSDLHFIEARRRAAQQELSTVLHEVSDENATHTFDPDVLQAKVTERKAGVDPHFRNYPEREEEARSEVVYGVQHQIDIYKSMKADDPSNEGSLRIRLEQVLTDWLAELVRDDKYPALRVHLAHRSHQY